MIKISSDKEKIIKYLDYKGVKKSEFYAKTGLSNGFLSSGSSLGLDKARIILDNYLDLNPNWLLTGKGEMLKSNKEASISNNEDKNRIPLVLATAVGGFGNNSFTIQERDVKAYYVIPKFKHKKIDFMIEVEGSSMYPKYNSGDVVACTVINENSFIQWNKTHVVATKEQGIIIKRLKKGGDENSLCMISDNESYDPFEVPKEEITGIALVVGVIRLE